MEKKGIIYSAVVPIHNEEGNITTLNQGIVAILGKLTGTYEIIYVNDGSTDGSFRELLSLKNVTIIDLNRNYGQATALDAGFKAARGDLIISLDGDGQNDPSDIPAMIKKLTDEHLDVVAGWRKDRKDSGGINSLTLIGRALRRAFIADTVHDTGCTLRVYRNHAVKSLDIGGEMHRYILAILKWKGFRIGEVIVKHHPRTIGKSKYNYSKAVRGFIDLIGIWFVQKFSQRPMHLFGYMSFLSFFFGIASGIWTLYGKIFLDLALNRNGWFLMTIFFFIIGIMLFSFGLIIDLLLKIHLNNSPYEKRYYIREVINNQ